VRITVSIPRESLFQHPASTTLSDRLISERSEE
jgi:hypothetical protein